MVTTYFILSVLFVLATIAGFVPTLFGRWLQSPASIFGISLALFTPQMLAFSIVLTMTFSLWGTFNTQHGLIGLGLHVCCWLVLFRYILVVRKAHLVLDGDTLDPKISAFASPNKRMETLNPPKIWPWIFSYTPAMKSVRAIRSVVYRRVGRVELKLDIYQPLDVSPDKPLPALIYFHGGAWVIGSRRQSPYSMYDLAAAGNIVFAVSYRLAPWSKLPAAIEDCKYAVHWVRENAAQYCARPDHIVVSGGSAGGHLAALLAVTSQKKVFQPGFETADTSVQGAVLFYPPTILTEEMLFHTHPSLGLLMHLLVIGKSYQNHKEFYQSICPVTQAHADVPPILIVHGTNDHIVPLETSKQFIEKLQSVGAKNFHLLEVTNAIHGFEIVPSPQQQSALRVVTSFLSLLAQANASR